MKKKARFIDYKLKADVMRVNLHKKMKKIDYEDYCVRCLKDDYGIIAKNKYEDEFTDLLFKYGRKWLKEAQKVNLASYKRINRLKERISLYLSLGQCIFATLTFNDDVLNSTTEKQRRVMVSRFLKGCSKKYVANIDYGNDDKYSHREHYHALVLTDFINDHWSGGFAWYEKVRTDNTNNDKLLAKYISKLCNHAIKDSTKRACYIYSR